VISDADRAAIDAALDAMDIDTWRPLDTDEADLVRRALAPAPAKAA
jgi:hypothetical protein